VDIAVVEVGLGGRLDATNVCSRPLVSIITSISRNTGSSWGQRWQILLGESRILNLGVQLLAGPLPQQLIS